MAGGSRVPTAGAEGEARDGDRAMLHAGDEVGSETGPPAATPRWARTTFAVLFAMNLLDYLDRNVLMSMQPQIKAELHDHAIEQWGLLTSIFLVSYSLVSPVMGWLGDRYRRTWLLGAGGRRLEPGDDRQRPGARATATWPWRGAFLGVGEATYGVIAPTILLDLFAREQRARLMSAFYLAMPMGSALGMRLGAIIALEV